MKNEKKISFSSEDLEKFLNSTNLILKENALKQITGGGTYKNYAESVGTYKKLPPATGG